MTWQGCREKKKSENHWSEVLIAACAFKQIHFSTSENPLFDEVGDSKMTFDFISSETNDNDSIDDNEVDSPDSAISVENEVCSLERARAVSAGETTGVSPHNSFCNNC